MINVLAPALDRVLPAASTRQGKKEMRRFVADGVKSESRSPELDMPSVHVIVDMNHFSS
jgi:hypothetical protein